MRTLRLAKAHPLPRVVLTGPWNRLLLFRLYEVVDGFEHLPLARGAARDVHFEVDVGDVVEGGVGGERAVVHRAAGRAELRRGLLDDDVEAAHGEGAEQAGSRDDDEVVLVLFGVREV